MRVPELFQELQGLYRRRRQHVQLRPLPRQVPQPELPPAVARGGGRPGGLPQPQLYGPEGGYLLGEGHASLRGPALPFRVVHGGRRLLVRRGDARADRPGGRGEGGLAELNVQTEHPRGAFRLVLALHHREPQTAPSVLLRHDVRGAHVQGHARRHPSLRGAAPVARVLGGVLPDVGGEAGAGAPHADGARKRHLQREALLARPAQTLPPVQEHGGTPEVAGGAAQSGSGGGGGRANVASAAPSSSKTQRQVEGERRLNDRKSVKKLLYFEYFFNSNTKTMSHLDFLKVHGNNYGPVEKNVPSVIELTYVSRRCFAEVPALNSRPLPDSTVDCANRPGFAEVDLKFPPFVN